MMYADALARSVKVSVPIAAIPPKGALGSAGACVLLRVRMRDGIELTAKRPPRACSVPLM